MARLKGWVPTYKKQNFIFKKTLEVKSLESQPCLEESLLKSTGKDHWAKVRWAQPQSSPTHKPPWKVWKGDSDNLQRLSPKAAVKADPQLHCSIQKINQPHKREGGQELFLLAAPYLKGVFPGSEA